MAKALEAGAKIAKTEWKNCQTKQKVSLNVGMKQTRHYRELKMTNKRLRRANIPHEKKKGHECNMRSETTSRLMETIHTRKQENADNKTPVKQL